MDVYGLPVSTEINGKEFTFNADFRNILLIFRIFNDPNLLDHEKVSLALENFYDDYEELGELDQSDLEYAVSEMMLFLAAGEEEQTSSQNRPVLYDWDKDFNIIVAPINRIQGQDIRGLDFFHWWSFISSFMEIGECTFNTYVGIRDKISRGARLEKWEEKIYRDNRSKIQLKKRVDNTTQALMDEILGKGV
jgi:hypothetical protein